MVPHIMTSSPWRQDRYRELFSAGQSSELLASIWRDVYADEYPAEIEPFGFVTRTDLRAFVDVLQVDRSATLLDMGCGRGGPGLWVARETGCELVGIDVLPEAVAQADRLKVRLMPSGKATFAIGSFTKTNLRNASVDAIMSVDAFWMVLDKPQALHEMARVIRPGGRFAMTTWIPNYMDIKGLLTRAGFQLLSNRETDDWKTRQLAVYDGICAHRHELPTAIGAAAAAVIIAEAELARSTWPPRSAASSLPSERTRERRNRARGVRLHREPLRFYRAGELASPRSCRTVPTPAY
jgi:SAM-dependent methyltransferase